jgi:6-phosphogluconolactonase
MKIEALADADSVARAGAALTAEEARAAVAARGRFVVAFSGGHTPWTMLRALADEKMPWPGVHLIQVDERVAPAGDPDRNLTHLRESLLAHCPLRPEQVHAMPVESADLEVASSRYAQTLRDVAGAPAVLDLVHLGLGPDGHTASLVPGDPVLDVAEADVALTGVYQRTAPDDLDLSRAQSIPTHRLARDRGGGQGGYAGAPVQGRRLDSSRARSSGPGSGPGRPRGGGQDLTSHRGDNTMRVGIATDHGGFGLKEDLVAQLHAAGHDVVDFGADKLSPDDDYPDYVVPLAQAVAAGTVERGVAVCGSGVGASICANKIPGVRGALIHDHFSAGQGVEDDHMNIICLGGRTVGPSVAWDLVRTFLAAEFSHAPRHLRRLTKVALLELQPTRTNR